MTVRSFSLMNNKELGQIILIVDSTASRLRRNSVDIISPIGFDELLPPVLIVVSDLLFLSGRALPEGRGLASSPNSSSWPFPGTWSCSDPVRSIGEGTPRLEYFVIVRLAFVVVVVVDDFEKLERLVVVEKIAQNLLALMERRLLRAEYGEAVLKRFGDANEALLNQVNITEAQSISMYIVGLPVTIEVNVRMFKPRTLADAFSLSSLQETTLDLVKQRYALLLSTPRTTNTSTFANRNNNYPTKNTSTLALPTPINQNVLKSNHVFGNRPRKVLSQKEYNEKGLRISVFIVTKNTCLDINVRDNFFTLKICGEEEETFEECLDTPERGMTGYVLPEEVPQYTPHISLNTLSDIPTYHTMMIRGHVLKQLLHILMDSCSTHNFLDIHKSKVLGCKIRKTCPLNVSVVGGNKLIRGCELVLGIQWLSTLGNIQWNFQELRMEFKFQGKKVVLRGTNQFGLTWMSGKLFSKHVNHQDAYLTSICYIGPTAALNLMQCNDDEELSNNTELYPPAQKDVIETMVKELLDSGVIRPSHGHFSSFIVMVMKKDGSWRMCIDYRLRYNQIRMHEEDVCKTAFKSHEGHYEFVAMPFELTKALLTFQALMNFVFRPFLRKFTLVIFNDILIYSPLITEQVDYLRMVMQVIRDNSLYAKRSKCTFGTSRVEYLGHVISA
ncbi:Fe(3+) dicitrate transport system permease [Tanacetum coccineum]